jgi:hypothetical protein
VRSAQAPHAHCNILYEACSHSLIVLCPPRVRCAASHKALSVTHLQLKFVICTITVCVRKCTTQKNFLTLTQQTACGILTVAYHQPSPHTVTHSCLMSMPASAMFNTYQPAPRLPTHPPQLPSDTYVHPAGSVGCSLNSTSNCPKLVRLSQYACQTWQQCLHIPFHTLDPGQPRQTMMLSGCIPFIQELHTPQ